MRFHATPEDAIKEATDRKKETFYKVETRTHGIAWVVVDMSLYFFRDRVAAHPEGEITRVIKHNHVDLTPVATVAVSARERAFDRAETLAFSEIEGTPLNLRPSRSNRRCVECGSVIYGEDCTHCQGS